MYTKEALKSKKTVNIGDGCIIFRLGRLCPMPLSPCKAKDAVPHYAEIYYVESADRDSFNPEDCTRCVGFQKTALKNKIWFLRTFG